MASSIGLPYAKNVEYGGVPRQTPTQLTFSRGWLRHVADQTVRIAQVGRYMNNQGQVVSVEEDLKKAMENSVHYHSSHIFSPPKQELYDTQYFVRYGSSIDVAMMLQETHPDAHVGVLNSASARSPGGKFNRGTISQEDCICRASLLYPCLLQFENKPHYFYYVNRKPKYQGSPSSCAIFTPLVPVIRDDTVQGTLLDKYYKFSFVSIPAPNAFVLGPTENVPKAQAPGTDSSMQDFETMPLNEAMRDRCFRALCIMAEHGCTDLVLCAFGCGVHGNNPVEVAATFRSILSNELKGRFRVVVFAIQRSRHGNYKAFIEAFPEANKTARHSTVGAYCTLHV
jgi:uncharacterized protein (TIGR02452 family)